jgi:hypothetical protein
LLAAEWGLQTNVDLAKSLDAKPSFSCPEVLLLGSGAKIVEPADLVADMDGGARVENSGVLERVFAACKRRRDGQEAGADFRWRVGQSMLLFNARLGVTFLESTLERCCCGLSFLLDSLPELFYSLTELGIAVHALLSANFSKLRGVNVAGADLGSGCPTVLEAVLPIAGWTARS